MSAIDEIRESNGVAYTQLKAEAERLLKEERKRYALSSLKNSERSYLGACTRETKLSTSVLTLAEEAMNLLPEDGGDELKDISLFDILEKEISRREKEIAYKTWRQMKKTPYDIFRNATDRFHIGFIASALRVSTQTISNWSNNRSTFNSKYSMNDEEMCQKLFNKFGPF